MHPVFVESFRHWLIISLRAVSLLILLVAGWLLFSNGSTGPIAAITGKSPARTAPAPFRLPAGGDRLLPAHRLVALYGAPDNPVLGTLGAQPIGPSLERAKATAAEYQPLSKEPILPTIEIITTVASAEPTDNGDYSRETDIRQLRPWVDAARAAGVYVILDLQPGSTDFPTQARQYESLLREPHVGLALDPEWRMQPGKQHLEDIGSVSIDEVNTTGKWLADLTARNKLPQKVFLLHQFRLSMIPDRQRLDTSRPELATIIQMDGQGEQSTKRSTYAAISADAPANTYFGWKNFYQQDKPMLTPSETMAQTPRPWYVSYQ